MGQILTEMNFLCLQVLKNKNNDDIIETNTITENEVVDDGNVESRKTSENDERYSEMQSANSGETVQDRSLDRLHTEAVERNERGGNRDISSRIRKSETRELSEVVDSDAFIKLANFVGNEITLAKYVELSDKCEGDSRFDDGYDFSEIVAYDRKKY